MASKYPKFHLRLILKLVVLLAFAKIIMQIIQRIQSLGIRTNERCSVTTVGREERPTEDILKTARVAVCHQSVPVQEINIRYHHKSWQRLGNKEHEIYLYGAYYDNRKAHMGDAFVQILVVAKDLKLAENPKLTFFCQLRFDGIDKSVPSPVQFHSITSMGGRTIDKVRYKQYFLSCLLPVAYAPSHVSLAFSRCGRPSNLLKTNIPERVKKHEFGICVPVSFYHNDPFRLIEWVEFHKILGVGEINVYPIKLSEENMELLRKYEAEGVVRVNPISSPTRDDFWTGLIVVNPLTLNDCMWKNMHRYGHVISVDFDEVIVPRISSNYSAMMKDIDRAHHLKAPHQSYSFRNAYFWTCETSSSGLNYSYALRYTSRERPSAFLYHTKSMIDPRRCLAVSNHFCFTRFPGLNRNWTIDVSPKLALSHHYRTNSGNCQTFKRNAIVDLAAMRFEQILKMKIQNKIKEFSKLGLFGKHPPHN